MADYIDEANNQAQLILDKQLLMARGKPLNIFQNESGFCWECAAPVTDGRRWCSKDCADRSEK